MVGMEGVYQCVYQAGFISFVVKRNCFPETSFFSWHRYATLLGKIINVTRGARGWAEREVYTS